MDEPNSKSIADYARELKERQRLLGSDQDQETPEDLLYVSYGTDEPCQYILEYAGGRRVLVEVDAATGKQHFLREL